MGLDTTLWFAGIAAEAAVVALLVYRRVWRTLPLFFVYCAWTLLSDGVNYGVHLFFPADYVTTYFVGMVLDSALQFCVLVELVWSVLRPSQNSLPRGALIVVGGVTVALGAAIWPFAVVSGVAHYSAQLLLMVHLQQTVSILRILFFLLLAGFSQLLSIGWRNRELQVATGLGFYSLVSLAVTMLHTHQTVGTQYSHLNQVVVVGYFCSLLYWIFSFAQQEAERREFTPQMQGFLLAVAGTARSARVALADSASAKNRKPGKK